MKIAFFGGDPLGTTVLNKLVDNDLIPSLVVCNPDRPLGRKQIITPPPTKILAQKLNLEVFQPENYDDKSGLSKLTDQTWDLFIVVAYNFILPNWLLNLPKHGTLNLHPSLLPKLRGASPIRTAIKDDLKNEVGVTIMLMDEKMDHGPILNQLTVDLPKWPLLGPELDDLLANLGAELLIETIPDWTTDNISPQTQNHDEATYCHRFTKADSEVTIEPFCLPSGHEARQIWSKICAFSGIGETFFMHQGKRVKITDATLDNEDNLQINRVIPAGSKEIDFATYLKQIKK